MQMAMNAIFIRKIKENIRFHLPPWLPGRRCFFMNIIEVKDGSPIKGETEPMSEEQLQKEYDFYIAESIVGMLYKEGKITQDELHKISALNRQKFSPKLAEIMP
ncbi:hypothetical protein T472_0201885 [Youngiibacter fragilis 232.1]|uniref:SHOCT-like domain-containing protein n=3 Tax=Bacillota TaxID=1239 RepID=V7I8W5_9CLOT|nr:hypothetical protein T472_0201885 [Youngiibacter fragilis 232.1]